MANKCADDARAPPKPWRAAYALLRACTSPPGFDLVLDDSLVLEHAEEGRVVASVHVGPELANRNGTLHGGAAAHLVDVVGSAALITAQPRGGVSLIIQTHYLAPLAAGRLAVVDARLLKAGHNYAAVQVHIYQADPGLAAAASSSSADAGAGAGAAPASPSRLRALLAGRLAVAGMHVKALLGSTDMGALAGLAPAEVDAMTAAARQERRQGGAAGGRAAGATPASLGSAGAAGGGFSLDPWGHGGPPGALPLTSGELRARLLARPQAPLRLPRAGAGPGAGEEAEVAAAASPGRRAAVFLHAVVDCLDGYDCLLSGLEVKAAGEGWCLARLPLTPLLLNTYETLHGGATALLVDVVGTAALVTAQDVGGVSLAIEVQYLGAARLSGGRAPELEVEARLVRAGRQVASIQVDLRQRLLGPGGGGGGGGDSRGGGQGQVLVARGTHTKALVAGSNLGALWASPGGGALRAAMAGRLAQQSEGRRREQPTASRL